MKNPVLTLLCLLPLVAAGQAIRVNISDNKEALPYSSVFVNSKFVAIADASGVTLIPEKSLNYGDTISSRYIGMHPASKVYDRQMQRDGKCELIHTEEEVYDLEPIMIVYYDKKDSRSIFRKYVKTYFQLTQNCVVEGDFTARITLPDGSVHHADGAFSLKNDIPRGTSRGEFAKYYFNTLPEIVTDSDTTRISFELLNSIRRVYQGACSIIGQLHFEHMAAQPYTYLNYLGEKEGKRFFRYVVSDPKYHSGMQFLFEADVVTQQLENVRYSTTTRSDERYAIESIDVLSRNLRDATSDTKVPQINVPEDIEANIIRSDGTVTDLNINNISIRFVK